MNGSFALVYGYRALYFQRHGMIKNLSYGHPKKQTPIEKGESQMHWVLTTPAQPEWLPCWVSVLN